MSDLNSSISILLTFLKVMVFFAGGGLLHGNLNVMGAWSENTAPSTYDNVFLKFNVCVKISQKRMGYSFSYLVQ